MQHCLGWHDGKGPIAKYRATNHYVRSCDACKERLTSHYDLAGYMREGPLQWRRITVKEHVLSSLARPFELLDQWLYRRGFRWKYADYLAILADRIYNGRNLFAPLNRSSR